MSQNTSRGHLVSLQVLARISLVMHYKDLMILSHISFTFCTFHSKQCLLQTPRRKGPEESKLENNGAREWVPSLLCNEQETPSPEGTNTRGEVTWCTI
jgi:hypothetical protein